MLNPGHYFRLIALFSALISFTFAALMGITRAAGTLTARGDIIGMTPALRHNQHAIVLYDARTSQTARVALQNDRDQTAIGWSSDGRRYASWGESTHDVTIVDLVTGQTSVISQMSDALPWWSPDGRALIYAAIDPSPQRVKLYRLNLENGTRVQLTDARADFFDLARSPDGRQIAFITYSPSSGSELYVRDIDGDNLRRLISIPVQATLPLWSPEGGQLLFFIGCQGSGSLNVINVDGSGLKRINDNAMFASWSPDNRGINFLAANDDGMLTSYHADLNSGKTRPLLPAEAHSGAPFWSPDGAKFAFAADMDGTWGIFIAGSDGTNPRRIATGQYAFRTVDWSRDGTRIAFDSPLENDRSFSLASADGLWLRRVDSGGSSPNPQWQP